MKLQRRYVEKPWGRNELPPMFDAPPGKRIGEIWFGADQDLPLLVKYIFTSERLSIQVHPNDEQARERGLHAGKSECWYIIDAEPGAVLGLGLVRPVDPAELRQAALDGSIERLIDWRPVAAGDFVFVPPGTVHAIGAGISLLEFQQNSDVTYRLYDYGRPRELHLDDGIAVADPAPFPAGLVQRVAGTRPRTLAQNEHFVLRQDREDALRDRLRWVVPLVGELRTDRVVGEPGDCLLLRAGEELETCDAIILIGAPAEQR